MRLLILPFLLFKGLLVNNPFKTIILVLCIFCWYHAGTLKKQRFETRIYHEFEINGQWFGIYGDSDPDVLVFNEKPLLVGKQKNIYVSYNYHPGNAFLWLGFGISLFILIVGTFVEDGWELESVLKMGLSVFVRCDIEDGVFVYTIFGRLLAKYKNQVETTNFHQLRSISSILTLPKYETKMSRRERLLRIIGI
jgi:hypothetical protein